MPSTNVTLVEQMETDTLPITEIKNEQNLLRVESTLKVESTELNFSNNKNTFESLTTIKTIGFKVFFNNKIYMFF